MNRTDVLRLCAAADDPDTLMVAMRARAEWLNAHPDDTEVFGHGESLSMLREGLVAMGMDVPPISFPPAEARRRRAEHQPVPVTGRPQPTRA